MAATNLRSVDQRAAEHFYARQSVAFAVKKNGPNRRPFWAGARGENEPDHAMSPPAETSGLEKLLLVLAVLSAALVHETRHYRPDEIDIP